MTSAIQLSHKSVEHYGPDYIGPMVRAVFGGPINLDPASCDQANQLIGAERYYTAADNGLALPWHGTVYLNPPGGRVVDPLYGEVNQAALWFATLAHRYDRGLVSQAIFMIFNFELFRYAQNWKVRQPLDFPISIPKRRIDFWKPGPNGRPVPQGSPGHPNGVIYMGPNVDQFRAVFDPPEEPGGRGRWPGGQSFNVPPF